MSLPTPKSSISTSGNTSVATYPQQTTDQLNMLVIEIANRSVLDQTSSIPTVDPSTALLRSLMSGVYSLLSIDPRLGKAEFGRRYDLNNGMLVLTDHEEEMETIRIIRRMRNERRVTYKRIAEQLIDIGRKNKDGRVEWKPVDAQRIYRSDIVLPEDR